MYAGSWKKDYNANIWSHPADMWPIASSFSDHFELQGNYTSGGKQPVSKQGWQVIAAATMSLFLKELASDCEVITGLWMSVVNVNFCVCRQKLICVFHPFNTNGWHAITNLALFSCKPLADPLLFIASPCFISGNRNKLLFSVLYWTHKYQFISESEVLSFMDVLLLLMLTNPQLTLEVLLLSSGWG